MLMAVFLPLAVFVLGTALGMVATRWWLLGRQLPGSDPNGDPDAIPDGISFECRYGTHPACADIECACLCHAPAELDAPVPRAELPAGGWLPVLPAATLERPMMHDFLHPDWEQLAPGRIDRPGPVSDSPAARTDPMSADAGTSRAGELQPWTFGYGEAPLPAILHLGQEGDGSDRTFGRWQVRHQAWLWQMQSDIAAVDAELETAA